MLKRGMIKEIRKMVRRLGYLPKLMRIPLDEETLGKAVYEAFLGAVRGALLRGEEVQIRKLGSFRLHYKEPKTQVCNITGETIDVEGRVKLRFVPSRTLLRELNDRLL